MKELTKNIVREKAWLTTKARMEAEKRFRKYEYTWHIVLCLASIVLIAASITEPRLPDFLSKDAYNIIASTIILSVTLIVFGFRFGERASQYREGYLKIQNISNSDLDENKFNEQYMKILDAYPNHDDYDYSSVLIKEKLFYGRTLTDANGNPIIISKLTYFFWGLSWVLFWVAPLSIVSIMVLPILISYL